MHTDNRRIRTQKSEDNFYTFQYETRRRSHGDILLETLGNRVTILKTKSRGTYGNYQVIKRCNSITRGIKYSIRDGVSPLLTRNKNG